MKFVKPGKKTHGGRRVKHNPFSHRKAKCFTEVLHSLLMKHPDGLTSRQISQQLGLLLSVCEELLRIEQIRDMIDADPFSGEIIYTSKRTELPTRSLGEIMEKATVRYRKLRVLETLFYTSMAIVSVTLVSIPIHISSVSFHIGSPNSAGLSGLSARRDLVHRSRVDAAIALQNMADLESEKTDLENRIRHMRSLSMRNNCRSRWSQNETCYLAGRLLTQEEFESELAEMNFMIKEVDVSLAAYGR